MSEPSNKTKSYPNSKTHSVNQAGSPLGRGVLWGVVVLSLGLLGYVVATAVSHNPLYSDREQHGMSKYKFIEECKKQLAYPSKVSMGPMGTLEDALRAQNMLTDGKKAELVAADGSAKEIVASVTSVSEPTGKELNGQAIERKTWNMTLPATLQLVGKEGTDTLTQLPLQCRLNRDTKAVALSLPMQ